MITYLQPILGFFALIGIAYLFSSDKKAISWRLVLSGLGLQVFLCLLLTKVSAAAFIFNYIGLGFVRLLEFSLLGAQFVFGDLARNSNALPHIKHNLGFIFCFQMLPTIVFFAAFTSLLYYLNILQKVVLGMAWLMSKTMKISGAESVSAAGNIFLGQTEAPLLVKPFLSKMSNSELLCIMTGGMATIAGGVMAAYISLLGGDTESSKVAFATHLLTASMMNAPAGIVFAKILLPAQVTSDTKLSVSTEKFGVNIFDALANGTIEGVKLAANVGGMLVVFISMIALFNYLLSMIGGLCGLNEIIFSYTNGQFAELSLQYIFGQICQPIAFLIGVEWNESLKVGALIGQKTAINEFVSYIQLAGYQTNNALSPKSILISTFALCGFSNFSSIAIQLGGLGIMAPNQQSNIAKLGIKAILASSLACLMSALWAGVII